MIILSIETSCDETAVSILKAEGSVEAPEISILGNALFSQATLHAEYGGVYPQLAKREHAKNLVPLLQSAINISQTNGLQSSDSHITIPPVEISEEKINKIKTILEREIGLSEDFLNFLSTQPKVDIDAIAVTQGPGLEPALWVGICFAKALSLAWNISLIPINHMEGHLVSVLMGSNSIEQEPIELLKSAGNHEEGLQLKPSVQFPALALLISGGHTELVHIKNWHDYEIIGKTRDDAIGEAFDKAARILHLPYPGGPEISKLASQNRSIAQRERLFTLPRPMISSDNLDFSFSGIKTAVLYLVRDLEIKYADGKLPEEIKSALAEEFENAVTEVIIEKTRKALIQTGARTLILGGGVVANNFIRSNFEQLIKKEFSDIHLFVPSVDMSTDNAVMIGIAAYLRLLVSPQLGTLSEQSDFRAQGNLSL